MEDQRVYFENGEGAKECERMTDRSELTGQNQSHDAEATDFTPVRRD
jgi:hypothetical protein